MINDSGYWSIGQRRRCRLAVLAVGAFLATGAVAACGDDGDGDSGGSGEDAGDWPEMDATEPATEEAAAATQPTCDEGTHDGRLYILCTAGDQPDQGVVVALHGKGSGAEEMQAITQLERHAAAEGLAVVYPEGIDQGWGDDTFPGPSRPEGDEDVAFLDGLIETVRSDPRIDDQPVDVVGFSNGASMALRYTAERPEEVDAVVSVAGQLPLDSAVHPTDPVPLLQIYGIDDPLRGYDTGIPATEDRQPGDSTPTMSTPDTIAAFVDTVDGEVDHEGPTESDPNPEDGTSLRTERWTHDGDTVAVLQAVEGGGHAWPGAGEPWELESTVEFGTVSRDLDASEEAIAFVLDPSA